jgi:UDP-N-acetylglucosamine enolpyruvyl transferase
MRPEGCLLIAGGRPLIGTYPISGAKNAVLPLMVAALVTPHLVTLWRCSPTCCSASAPG